MGTNYGDRTFCCCREQIVKGNSNDIYLFVKVECSKDQIGKFCIYA